MKPSLKIAAVLVAVALGAASAHAADAGSKAPAGQQSKMKQCNVDAKGMKGDERRAFMKQCLSKKAA